MTLRLTFFLVILITGTAHGASRYWIANSDANWNDTNNWSTTSTGSGGASIPISSDIAYFTGNGIGNCNIDTEVNVLGFNINFSYTGTISQNTHDITVGTSDFSMSS